MRFIYKITGIAMIFCANSAISFNDQMLSTSISIANTESLTAIPYSGNTNGFVTLGIGVSTVNDCIGFGSIITVNITENNSLHIGSAVGSASKIPNTYSVAIGGSVKIKSKY